MRKFFAMVKLTTKYLIRKIRNRKQFLVRRKGESDKQFLNRITHLYLNGQFIDQLTKITDCQNVAVIYLHNNMLRTLENIDSFPNLTHLYLQRNFLTKIEYLEPLQQLKKIYLGFNEILVLEGLADLENLKEIHIENQDLPLGETLLFEPQTIRSLQTTLRVLNVSQNCLTSLSAMKGLLRLEVLIATDNCLSDLTDLLITLKEWPFLKKLSLTGNPVAEDRSYRDGVIFASKTLEELDGKTIHDITRKFIEKLTERRKYLTATKDEGDDKKEADDKDMKESKSVTFSAKSAMADDLIGPLNTSAGTPFSSPAWQLRGNVNPVNSKSGLPRPFWKKGGMDILRARSSKRPLNGFYEPSYP